MINHSYSEIIDRLDNTSTDQLPPLNILLMRNITLDPLVPYLRYLALSIGYDAKVMFSNYGTILQDAVGDNKKLFSPSLDFILVFLKLEQFCRPLARAFSALSSQQLENERDGVLQYITGTLTGIREKTDATILWHTFEYPVYPAFGIHEHIKMSGQLLFFHELDFQIRSLLASFRNVYPVNLNICRNRIGEAKWYDYRYWHMAQSPYTREALREIALEDFKYIRACRGKTRKCLVLDCDNTLWGGIVGEDGLEGIEIGQEYPGSAYFELQQEVLNLYHRGIILALCSKNNESDIDDVFDNHPGMLLKREHFAATRINWQDKVENLHSIATELNIGLDSMVFVDDSPFEIESVREVLPEVAVIQVDTNNVTRNSTLIASCGYFDTITLSEEDKKRGLYYKQETQRRSHEKGFKSVSQYLKSLEIILAIANANHETIPRIAQLAQRTNQFNLTAIRYSAEDIRELSESNVSDVFTISLADRFGDMGIIGVAILKYEKNLERAIIDNLMLSCRALGRNVEDVFLARILSICKKNGFKSLLGFYRPTEKNMQVRDFYSNHGFTADKRDVPGNTATFVFDLLKNELSPFPAHFKKITLDLEA